MQLLKTLGSEIYGGQRKTMGIFLCPNCNEEVKKTKDKGHTING